MRFVKALVGLLVILGLTAGLVFYWATSRLAHDNPRAPRPQFQNYELSSGVADGTAKPSPTGYAVDSAGHGWILPEMPEARPLDVHTAANSKRDLTIKSCFWPGPRARSGVYTNDTDSFHFENQFPDTATTYIPTAFKLPPGAKLVIKGKYPHMRHWNFNTYNPQGLPQDALSDIDINPDPGSSNPFRPGVPRDVETRNYTVYVVSGPAPSTRAPNTLYTNADAGEEVFLWMRNFVPDHSIDYVGGVGVPQVQLQMADGKVLDEASACAATDTPMRGKQLAHTVNPVAWEVLTHLPWVDTANVGASNNTVQSLQAFFNRKQVVLNMFIPALSPSAPEVLGGWWSNRATRYGYLYLSRNFGKVYVATGQLPTTPKTWDGQVENSPNSQVRYISFCTGGALAAATTTDCLYDEQIERTLDKSRHYYIVISRPEDRPKNATEQCGVAWLDFGNGDGMVSGSPDSAILINRHTMINPSFEQSWFAVKKPGTEAQVMGDYLPHVINMREKDRFEALGCPVNTSRLQSVLAAN
ncbi:hypothetical protein [Paraburkholderia gardini]|uniref:hypothetical protein n=1 Tax=Paraburkholderia gardini TaxID=2823469 RepID=UPI001E0666DB|nr:hypothetical protein [Paraburkholderia gardini]CAG4925105.1 hypothetical protein R69919_05272 [Paraburkholderia gardini]